MLEKKEPKVPVFRPNEPGLEKMLGALEAQIMQVLWSHEQPQSVGDVRDELARHGKDAAYTTIMTTLGRLFTKGLLTRETRGKAYLYAPRVSRRDLTQNVTRQVISGLLTTFTEPAIAYFVEALEEQDPAKLDALAAVVEAKRKERRGS
jgi:predicted transcriptional regulator